MTRRAQVSTIVAMSEISRSIKTSQELFQRAHKLMPGGVSSPVRAFKAVGGTPLFIKEASGCTITDVDGNKYIDYVASYGPMIAGHANERVVAALSKAIGRGTSYGAPTESEVQLAGQICSAMPSIEMVRFVNSGTEATMSAIRLARAATKRDAMVKNHTTFFVPWDTIHESNPQEILERHEKVSLVPLLIMQGALDDNVLPVVQEKFAATYKAAGGDCDFHVFEGCEHEWVATPGPQTDRAREMVKAFVARQLHKHA